MNEKMSLPFVLRHVLHIVNFAITCSICPKVWKMAKVIPSHKKGKLFELDDFRLLSICLVSRRYLNCY